MNSNFSDQLKTLSERVRIILVAPKYEGNIGAVARSMRNSGLSDLAIVNPPYIGDEAMARAMAGRDILDGRKIYQTLEEASRDFSVIAATSSVATLNRKKFRRIPVSPDEFWQEFSLRNDRIAIVFGREDDGLRNEEIEFCNYFINIPGSPDYPVYNLSHAAAIILYEMMKHVPNQVDSDYKEPISSENYNILMERIEELLDIVSFPKSRRRNIDTMIRRITARSSLTQTEYFKIMGIIRILIKHLESQ
ncbi:MAG: RNA methyltransferase [Thermoplasmataceae archaeon]